MSGYSVDFGLDGGHDSTMCVGDLAMAVQWSDGAYFTSDFSATGGLTRTAKPGNTSMRAPGNLQSISVREMVNERVATHLGMDIMDLRERNFYQIGQTTPFGDVIGSEMFNWTLPTLW